MATLSKFKRGDTFLLTCTNKNAGVVEPVTGYLIKAQIRTSTGGLVAELTPTIADQTANPGVFYLRSSGSTAEWKIGMHVCDIQITAGTVTRSTQTFCVPVVDDVTK